MEAMSNPLCQNVAHHVLSYSCYVVVLMERCHKQCHCLQAIKISIFFCFYSKAAILQHWVCCCQGKHVSLVCMQWQSGCCNQAAQRIGLSLDACLTDDAL